MENTTPSGAIRRITDRFVYGTQYYRAPTPLPPEWPGDLAAMGELGLDAIQLRVQWRWNEPAEGQYDFSDLDELFELAARNGKQVIVKFLMENAPDYVYGRLGGSRMDMHGRPLPPLAHGAYYCGGWLPCFDNPAVIEHAKQFVRTVVERYRERPELLLWHIWNEPGARPIGECGCPHSIRAYRDYLQKHFDSITALNNFFGKRFESFDTVNPPGGPYDFAELYLWRRWAMTAVSQRLRFMYDTVRALDPERPIMCHVGASSPIQDAAQWASDDVMNAREVDFYGCSLLAENRFTDVLSTSWPTLQTDWQRSLRPYFWVHELYPDWGAWRPLVTNGDYLFKVMSTVAGGAKGLFYWQYRAERLGMEHNLSGLVHIDGSFKPFAPLTAAVGRFVAEHHEFLQASQVVSSPIAIVYSVASDLINRVENTGNGDFWDFSLNTPEGTYLYKRALCGIYAAFRELGYTVDWLDSRSLPEKARQYRLLYLPEFFMPTAEEEQALADYFDRGGKAILEEGAGLRAANTWVHPTWPGGRFRQWAGARIDDRVLLSHAPDVLTVDGVAVTPGPENYASYLLPEHGSVIGRWQDGRPGAIQPNEHIIYLGTSLGGAFHHHPSDRSPLEVLRRLLTRLGMELPPPVPELVYLRRLEAGSKRMLFVFNRNRSDVTFPLPEAAAMRVIFGDGQLRGGALSVTADSVCVLQS